MKAKRVLTPVSQKDIVAAAQHGACPEAIEWFKKRQRYVETMPREYVEWAWLYPRGLSISVLEAVKKRYGKGRSGCPKGCEYCAKETKEFDAYLQRRKKAAERKVA